MSGVVLSLPRCGSAWLASYLGYLHDPITHLDMSRIGPRGVVDTGCGIDVDAALRKYTGRTKVFLVRNPEEIRASLSKMGFPTAGPELEEAYEYMHTVSMAHGTAVYYYDSLFSGDLRVLDGLCRELGCEFDAVWAENAMRLHVEHQHSDFLDGCALRKYKEWLYAPTVR